MVGGHPQRGPDLPFQHVGRLQGEPQPPHPQERVSLLGRGQLGQGLSPPTSKVRRTTGWGATAWATWR